MNRNAEWDGYRAEIAEHVPASIEHCAQRAIRRARKRSVRMNLIRIPTVSIMAMAIVFTVAVNTSLDFAKAVGEMPALRELARFVARSPSIKAAVENNHVQTLGLSEERDGIIVTIHYAIADERRLSLYYEITDTTGERGELVAVDTTLWERGAENPYPLLHGFPNNPGGHGSGIMEMRFEIAHDMILPSETMLTFVLRDASAEQSEPGSDSRFAHSISELPDDAWRFELSLEPSVAAISAVDANTLRSPLDDQFENGSTTPDGMRQADLQPESKQTPQNDVVRYSIDEWLEVEGQRVYIMELAVYPTGSWLSYRIDPDNSSLMTIGLLELEDENGNIWGYRQDSGVSAYLYPDGTMEVFIESSYFANPQSLTLIISSISLYPRETRYATLDAVEMTLEGLPGNMRLDSMEQVGELLNVRIESDFDMINGERCYYTPINTDEYITANGDKHELIWGDMQETDEGNPGVFYSSFSVKGYEDGPILLELSQYLPAYRLYEATDVRIPVM